MGNRAAIPLLLIAGLLATPVAADILTPGAKFIDYCVEIDNTGDYPGYTFLLYPLWMGGGYAAMGPGDCVSFYKFAIPSFFAVREDQFNETAAGTEGEVSRAYFTGDPVMIPSGVEVESISAAPVTSPVRGLRVRFRIQSVDTGRLEIVPSSVHYTYTDGRTEEKPLGPGETPRVPSGIETLMLAAAAVLVVGAAAIVWLMKRNR